MTMKNPSEAIGLRDEDRELCQQAYDTWLKHLHGNRERVIYYRDKQPIRNLGLAVPNEFIRDVRWQVGWAAKAVDMLAARSVLDGVNAVDGEVLDIVESIVRDNDLQGYYNRAKTSELVHGVGFWAVHADPTKPSRVNINYYSAERASAVYDWDAKRIKAGLIIGAAPLRRTNSDREDASNIYLLTDEYEIEIVWEGDARNGRWVVPEGGYKPHSMGRPPMVAMCYKPDTDERVFGKARITKAVMGIVDEMGRSILRAALTAETSAAPQKYILGASEKELKKSKFSLYLDQILALGPNREGEIPTFGQLSQLSMEPHISYMEHLANRMAAETSLPVAAFGVPGNGYTSSDALRASSDDIILEAEALNAGNGEALRELLIMGYAIAANKPYAELEPYEKAIYLQWRSPVMPSLSSVTDAMVKQASIVTWLPETSVYWEMLGYSDEQVKRIMAEKDAAMAAAQLNAQLLSGGGDVA